MSEVPYREVVEGAKFLMKMPVEKQLRLLELIMRSVPASVDETIRQIIDEFGPADLKDIREVLAFTVAIIKSLATKEPSEVIKGLKRMGFTEENAKAIVDKVLSELPSAEKDADLLRELDKDELSRLVRTWVRFFTGDYDGMTEWAEDVGLATQYLLAATRFFESSLKSVLMGEMSLRKLQEALIKDYGFEPEKAEELVRGLEEHIDELSRTMLFKYLKRILDAIE
ncbi:hypothetical protein DRO33_03745 [Candidatus Bathyarchaeota archaeon]|nr:MAG: hypothetical protein DRO33_03745 [Candidatus Bathyarchaeota archaeon]